MYIKDAQVHVHVCIMVIINLHVTTIISTAASVRTFKNFKVHVRVYNSFDHVTGHVILTWSPVAYWHPSPPSWPPLRQRQS